MKKTTLKTIFTTSLVIFDLAIAFVSTTAWFVAARKVDADGDAFEVVAYDGLIESISLYPQDYETITSDGNETRNYKKRQYKNEPFEVYYIDSMTGNAIKSKDSTVNSLGIYDQLESGADFSVLYSIKINNEVLKNRDFISIYTTTKTTKETSCLSSEGVLQKNDNSLCSIVSFNSKSSLETSEVFDYSSNPDFTSQTFYTLTTNDDKTTSLTDFSSSLSLLKKKKSELETASTGYSYFEFIVEYDANALEYLYSLNLGRDVLDLDDDEYISFKQDYKIVIK